VVAVLEGASGASGARVAASLAASCRRVAWQVLLVTCRVRCADGPANTKDLLDSMSVVSFYASHFLSSQKLFMPPLFLFSIPQALHSSNAR
jgi:hypothetical protein